MHVLNMDKDSNNGISVCASVSVSQKLRYQTLSFIISFKIFHPVDVIEARCPYYGTQFVRPISRKLH